MLMELGTRQYLEEDSRNMENAHNPTRKEILVLLKQSDGMTVDQLSEALAISAMGVRQHLAVLERDGFVEATKKRGGMGRPAHIYALTAKGDELFPRKYETLAMDLLQAVEHLDGPERVEAVLEERTKRFRDSLAPQLEGLSLGERFRELTRLQQENGYMADLEERPDGYVFIQHNCTIALVAKRFPSVCRMEHEMFESLTGTRLQRQRCIAFGDTCCAYFARKDTSVETPDLALAGAGAR